MDSNANDLKAQKIKMWQDKYDALEKEYMETMKLRGEAAAMGDLRENAAYQGLTEQGEILSARMNDISKMVKSLQEGDDKKPKQAA